jgi:hypothetical protein
MSTQPRPSLISQIASIITTNGNGEVTGEAVRNALTLIINADYNLADDEASLIKYTPETPANWAFGPTGTSAPVQVKQALDALSKNSIEYDFYAHTDSPVSNIQLFRGPGIIIGATHIFNSTRVASVLYEISTDNISYNLVGGSGAIGALNNSLSGLPVNQFLYVRAVFTFQSTAIGEEQVKFNYKKL